MLPKDSIMTVFKIFNVGKLPPYLLAVSFNKIIRINLTSAQRTLMVKYKVFPSLLENSTSLCQLPAYNFCSGLIDSENS